MKTALITGGTGFIGKALARRLKAEGWNVRILSRRAVKDDEFEVVRGDYDDVSSLERATCGCDAVFHLAAAIFASSEEEFRRANTRNTANMVTACCATKPDAFIYVSSLAAGGPSEDPKNPRNEDWPEAPASAYGRTKLGGERELLRLPVKTKRVVLRPPIVYGKNDSGVSKIAKWVRRGLMINMCAGETYFSFIYRDNLVDCLVLALTSPNTAGKTYFVGETRSYTWTYFINEMAAAMGVKKPFMPTLPPRLMLVAGYIYAALARLAGVAPEFNPDKAREASAGHWISSPEKWMRDTGYSGWTPLPEGLRKTFAEADGSEKHGLPKARK